MKGSEEKCVAPLKIIKYKKGKKIKNLKCPLIIQFIQLVYFVFQGQLASQTFLPHVSDLHVAANMVHETC